MSNYLCKSWQGLIQMSVYLVSRGYYWYCLTEYPEKKRDSWAKIDQKLIEKYDADKSKFQRARQKQKYGMANFYFLRWESVSVIFHSKGKFSEKVTYNDTFYDIRKKPLKITISDNIEMVIYEENETTSVRLSRESYRGFKACLIDVCKLKEQKEIIKEFNKINGLPAWRGIIEQKQLLASFTVREARKHQVWLRKEALRIKTQRTPVKVFA